MPPHAIQIADQQTALPIDRQALKNLVLTVLAGERCRAAKISVAIVDDAAIQALNLRYLNHDYPTDVLTFPLENGARGLEAEIVISSETALRQAEEFGTSAQHELRLYVIHGLLHLFDYDDHDPGFAAAMRAREEHYLRLIEGTGGGQRAGGAGQKRPQAGKSPSARRKR
ncbi:MAG: rRNA maturation RNase YbeY [Pirellulales bacterium]|nr:rRNA maturation RNase YbeY [Pirellulales bacterium]